MPRTFAINYDYLCAFSRNLHEHVAVGLRAGADWDVAFIPFSQVQGKADEGELPDVWTMEDPSAASGILALMASVAVRDHMPERFLDAHLALFAARHDHARHIRDRAVIRQALTQVGVDADAVFAAIDSGESLATLRREHEESVAEHQVWGVPTVITSTRAVFVRLLDRPSSAESSIRAIEALLDLVDGAPNLHEFKQVDLPF